MKTTKDFVATIANYSKYGKRQFYKVIYAVAPNAYQEKSVFAEDEIDAANKIYDIFSDAYIVDIQKG